MKRIVLIGFSLLLCFFTLSLFGCVAEKEEKLSNQFYVYFKNTNQNQLYPVAADIDLTQDANALIQAVYHEMEVGADERDYISPISQEIRLLNCLLEKQNLILNFDSAYLNLSTNQELLCRSALVKTMAQFEAVSTVEIRVENQPLALSDGTVVGPQTGDHYINPFDRGLNAYNRLTTILYFGSSDGTTLKTDSRQLTFRNTISQEQAVLEEILKEPKDKAYLRTVPENTKIISVATKENICYVNFSEDFLEHTGACLPEITIYSIVNSLTEIPGINSVQFSINGSSNLVYLDKIDLRNPINRDLNYVVTEK